MKIVAVEEHFTPQALETYMRSKNLPMSSRDTGGRKFLDKRLADMEEAGIDTAVLSVGVAGLENFPLDEAVALAREMNDEMADLGRQYPGKFAAFAVLPTQDPESAAAELERSVKKLGLKGTMIRSNINGEYLDEPKFRVLLQMAAALEVPIYIHPGQPPAEMIKPYQKYPILTGAFWGFAAETGLHAMRLVCNGVFDELPGLKIMLGHMGEALPYWMWRMDRHWTDWKGPNQPKKRPSDYVRENFYINNSGMFWSTVIQFAYNALGAERLMVGSDYPIESMKQAVDSVLHMEICDEDKEKILHGNAEKALKL